MNAKFKKYEFVSYDLKLWRCLSEKTCIVVNVGCDLRGFTFVCYEKESGNQRVKLMSYDSFV